MSVTDNIFARATRLNLKFNEVNLVPNASHQTRRISNVTVSDVWQLNLEDLDVLAQKLDVKLKNAPAKSFISGVATSNTDIEHLQLQFDITVAIINKKIEERDASRKRAETTAQKEASREVARELLLQRRAEALQGLSEAELEAIVNS